MYDYGSPGKVFQLDEKSLDIFAREGNWQTNIFVDIVGNPLYKPKLENDYFGFGGDDDVDYNSSYIFIVNEFLMWLWKRNLLDNYRIKESK